MIPERTIGETFRLAREERGESLEEVSRTTRLALSVLREVEQDHFEALAGPVYVKNYIRILALHYGLDDTELLERYRLGEKKQGDEKGQNVWREEGVRETRLKGLPAGKLMLVLAVLILAAFLLRLILGQGSGDRGGEAALERGSGLVLAADGGAPFPLRAITSADPAAEGAASLRLNLEATGRVDLTLNVDEERIISRRFGPRGGNWQIEGDECFLISTNRPGRLKATLGDARVTLPARGALRGYRIDRASAEP